MQGIRRALLLSLVCYLTRYGTPCIDQFARQQFALRQESFTTVCVASGAATELRILHQTVARDGPPVWLKEFTKNEIIGASLLATLLVPSVEGGMLWCEALGCNDTREASLHLLDAPFDITSYPTGRLQLTEGSREELNCVVKVAEEFPVELVDVSLRYYKRDIAQQWQEYSGIRHVDEYQHTISYSLLLEDITSKYDGVYECVAETSNMMDTSQYNIPFTYRTHHKTIVTVERQDTGSPEGSNLLILLSIFSAVTGTLVIVLVLVVTAVVCTKRHKARSYPVSPDCESRSGTFNTYCHDPTEAKTRPTVSHHITPKPKLFSSSSEVVL